MAVCWLLLGSAAAFSTPRVASRSAAKRVRRPRTSLASSILTTDDVDEDRRWDELEQIARTFQEESGRIMFQEKELLHNNNPTLAAELSVNFAVPSTWNQAVTQFASQPQVAVLTGALVASLLFRLSPLLGGGCVCGLSDLVAVLLTKTAWEVQEWAYHSRNFHGNGGRSHFPFAYHDRHHDLPYYHVAMEPTAVCASYVLAVSALAVVVSSVMGPSSLPVVSTVHASFFLWSLQYLLVHYLAHSKVPLKGWFQQARTHHVQHHLNHEINLNMASRTVDRIMKTTTTTTANSHDGTAKRRLQ